MTRIVHGISRELLKAAFCDYFGVAEEHADVLVLLYERPGEPITWRDLGRLVSTHRPPSRGALHMRISDLRKALDAESLDSAGERGEGGYYLTEVGLEECVKALRVMADALVKCGPATMLAGRNVEAIRAGRADREAAA